MKGIVTVPHRWLDLEIGDQIIEKLPPEHVEGARERIVASTDWKRNFTLYPQVASDGAIHTIVTRSR